MEIIQGHSYKFDTKSATNIDSHEDDEKNNSHECYESYESDEATNDEDVEENETGYENSKY